MRLLFSGLVMLGLLSAIGCGSGTAAPPDGGVAVSDTVELFNGATLKGGKLYLKPLEGVHNATASIQQDGSFTLVDSFGRNAVLPGRYLVYVSGDGASKSVAQSIPAKYRSVEEGDSDVEVTIDGPRSDLKIKLKK